MKYSRQNNNTEKPSQTPWLLYGLLFALLLSVAIAAAHSSIRFTGIQCAEFRDEMIYGINIDRTTNQVFAISRETGTGIFRSVDQLSESGITTFPDIEVTKDGRVYLLREKYKTNNSVTMHLVQWNLKNNRMKKIREIPVGTDRTLVDFVIVGDNFYFLFYGKDDQGNDKKTAGVMMADGTYRELENAENAVLWQDNVAGVSLSDLPYEGVRLPASRILYNILLYTLLIFAAEILISLIWLWWKTSRRQADIVVRLVIWSIILFVVLIPGYNKYRHEYLYEYTSESELRACAVEAELLEKMTDSSLVEDLVSRRIDPKQSVYSGKLRGTNMNTAIAWKENGQVVFMGDLFGYGVPVLRLSQGSLKDCVDKVWGQDRTEGFLYVGSRGMHAMVMHPMKTQSGQDAVICVQTPMRTVLFEFYIMRRKIVYVGLLIWIFILWDVFFILYRSLLPLKKMKKAAADLAAGQLETRVTVKGQNEFAYAAREFNAMAEKLQKQQKGADIYSCFYEAFLPMNIVRRAAGKNMTAALQPGYFQKTEALVLALSLPDVPSGAAELVKLQEELAEMAVGNAGSILSYGEGTITAVFPDNAGEALRCVLLMQRRVQEAAGRPAYMGMTAETILLQTEGNQSRRCIRVQYSGEAKTLAEMAAHLGEAMILTESLWKRAERTGSVFHFRKLGRIIWKDYVPEDGLQALMDAEMTAERDAKELTRPEFEAGVEAYASGDYYTARRQMIYCLDQVPGDRTARCYCLNCDRKEPPAICQAQI